MPTSKPAKRKRGRPTKCNAAVAEQIATAIEKGCGRIAAAALAGVDDTTFCRWMVRGEQPGAENEVYRAFRRSVCSAEHRLEQKAAQTITDLFDPLSPDRAEPAVRLNAAKFILTHGVLARSTKREVSGPEGGPVQVKAEVAVRPLFSDEQLASMTPEQLAAALGSVAGRGGA